MIQDGNDGMKLLNLIDLGSWVMDLGEMGLWLLYLVVHCAVFESEVKWQSGRELEFAYDLT